MAFVSALPRWFAPSITTVPAGGPSAEWFDRSPPRHPPGGRTRRLASRSLDRRSDHVSRITPSPRSVIASACAGAQAERGPGHPFKPLSRTPSTIRRLATRNTTRSGPRAQRRAGHDRSVRFRAVGAAEQRQRHRQREHLRPVDGDQRPQEVVPRRPTPSRRRAPSTFGRGRLDIGASRFDYAFRPTPSRCSSCRSLASSRALRVHRTSVRIVFTRKLLHER
jgi:hypothetical protein